MTAGVDPAAAARLIEDLEAGLASLRALIGAQKGPASLDPILAEEDDLVPYWEAADELDRSVPAVRALARRHGFRVYRNKKPLVSMNKLRAWLLAGP